MSVNGHEHEQLIASQVAGARITRSSDYPVLFYLAPLVSQLRSAFDLGGSVGNLFYVLSDHLSFSKDFIWMVHDFPAKKQLALALARDNNEHRVTFADVFSAASGVDLFIAVGAIHYFESTLSELLCTLDKLPAHVILNRSPFFESQDMTVVHDGGDWIIPCKLHDSDRLVREMVKLGYDLAGSWSVPERTMQIPLYPEYRETYKGFYFRMKSTPLPPSDTETGN
jgi:putative methyltransferase (TIGR04325 family)